MVAWSLLQLITISIIICSIYRQFNENQVEDMWTIFIIVNIFKKLDPKKKKTLILLLAKFW